MDVRFADCRYDLADPPAARARYLAGHIPGAAYLDLDSDLSDLSVPPEVGGRHPLPSAAQFAASAGRAGIGADTLVAAYDEDMSGGAARLWWLLRHFGHDAVGVLGGALPSWLGPLAEGEEEIEPAEFVARETERRRRDDRGDPRSARRSESRARRRASRRSLPGRSARARSRSRPHPGRDQPAGQPWARPCRRSCSTRTRSSPTAAPASPPACRCSRFIALAARTRASIRARGANGRARACPQRLDARAKRSLLSIHDDSSDLDVGVGMAQRAGRKRGLRPTHSRFARRDLQQGGLFRFWEPNERHHRHTHRPRHPARGIPPAARDGSGGLSPRVGRARAARPLLVRRLRLRARLVRRGRGARRARRRLSRLRPRGDARADGRAAGRRARRFRRAGSSSRPRSSASTTRTASPRCCGATRWRRRRSSKGRDPRCRSREAAEGTCAATRRGSTTSGACGRRSSTSARATPSRSSSRSARSGRRRRARSASTGRYAGSTLRRTTSCSSSATSRSSARRPRRSCGSTAAARASTRSPGRCRARPATSSGCSPRRRTAPST